jgi:chromate transporter
MTGEPAALVGPFLVAVLIGRGLIEAAVRARPSPPQSPGALMAAVPAAATGPGLLSLARLAFKVGALSFGGGFVIIPLMQHDAVHTYHWMTAGQLLTAVALGQVGAAALGVAVYLAGGPIQ